MKKKNLKKKFFEKIFKFFFLFFFFFYFKGPGVREGKKTEVRNPDIWKLADFRTGCDVWLSPSLRIWQIISTFWHNLPLQPLGSPRPPRLSKPWETLGFYELPQLRKLAYLNKVQNNLPHSMNIEHSRKTLNMFKTFLN